MTANPELSLLGRFGGEKPPAAAWFTDALACAPERSSFDADGVAIELLTWGDVGKPGLLFLHGSGAHADWWSFIAPFFAADYRCAAISWPGMGGSGWRDRYSIAGFGDDILAAIDAAGLGAKPIVIGHSFGGLPLMHIGAHHPDRIAGGIMIDSFVPRPGHQRGPPSSGMPTKRYATLTEALARYRFAPPQPSDWPEIVDHLARGSLREVPGDADGAAGWTWKFDPALWPRMERSGVEDLPGQIAVPIALIYGEQSALVTMGGIDVMRGQLRDCPIAVSIPQARHHIMADQPIALISALRVAVQALSA